MSGQKMPRQKMNDVQLKGMGVANWLVPLLLLLTVLVVYSRMATFGFVNYDDPAYTFENPHVNVGLTTGGVIWAFTQSYVANWHPLTWISHMLDFQLFGAQSGIQHIVNLFLHAATTLLLFFLLKKITGSIGCALFVAFGFALHPLHVESVAWISERKDVLSTLFFVLTLWAYVDYARDPRPVRYFWVVGWFVCALLSKQMTVTLPLVLLVIDFWPLRRGVSLRSIKEKLPLIALSLGAAMIAFFVQRGGGAVSSFEKLPLSIRLMNVPVAYATYMVQFVWPMNLTVFYPYDPSPDWWKPVAASIGLIAISIVTWRQRAKRPYLLAGWLWYLITLLPVVGIVQIGAQAHADRYTYIPLIGILIALAWGARDLAAPPVNASVRYLAAGVAVSWGLFWMALTWIQIGYWVDSIALFQHAGQVTANNYVAYNNLGFAFSKAGKLPEAIVAYQDSVRSQPSYADAHYNLGTALMDTPGREPDAIRELNTALVLDPQNAKARNNLGKLLAQGSASVPAPALVEHFEAALRTDPNQVEAHINLANALGQQGRFEDALREYRTALRLDPSRAITHVNLANVLASMPGRIDEAIAEYRAAIRIAPELAGAHYNLASALAQAGRRDDAVVEYRLASKADPHLVQAHNDLGVLLAQTPGRMEDAIAEFEAAIRQQPNFFDAHMNLGRALSQVPGRSADAIGELQKAYAIQPDPRIKGMIQQLRGSR